MTRNYIIIFTLIQYKLQEKILFQQSYISALTNSDYSVIMQEKHCMFNFILKYHVINSKVTKFFLSQNRNGTF